MEKQDIVKYLGHKVFLTVASGFKYKIILSNEIVKEDSLSFKDKYGNPVDFKFEAINFITISKDDGGYQDG